MMVSSPPTESSVSEQPAASAKAPATEPQSASAEPPQIEPPAPPSPQTEPPAKDRLQAWLSDYAKADATQRTAMLPQGLALAKTRRSRMARLILEDPEQALRESLPLHLFAALPDELRPEVETPFSELASYRYYPVCQAPAGTPDSIAQLSLQQGEVDAHTYGRRGELMSKDRLPVQGITLEGQAAVHDQPLRVLESAEIVAARQLYPSASPAAERSFLTGKTISGAPVVALGGGQLFSFASEEEVAQVNEALRQMEQLPGPKAGSDALFHQGKAAAGSTSAGFDLNAALIAEQAQASQWTETEKRVFIIRVDFSDRIGASHTQQATLDVLNGIVSPQIRAMSYGKTWINAEVSANVYRMPQTSAWYVNGTAGDSRNNELLRDARNTFRNLRAGGDATVNLGPVSSTGTGASNGLGNYDIVGVLFTNLNMRSGFVYGGLAGGGDLWMQGNIHDDIFTHEFGHNYGLGHASLWQTTDNSALGTGSNVEYGDEFDIMGDGLLPRGHFHPQAKALLNWLTPSEWTDTTAAGSGTYRLRRIDSQFTTGSPRGLRITRSATAPNQQYLWLGYRPGYSSIPRLNRGAYLVWQRPGQSRSWLVDTTPTTSGMLLDAPIALGQTFADTTSRAFITPLAVGGSGDEAWLDVRVNYGPFAGNAAPTIGSISGPTTVAARQMNTYSITASDVNTDTLAYAWNPGTHVVPDNASTLSQSWTVGGTYTLAVTVSDMKGGTATANRVITVTDPLNSWTSTSLGTSYFFRELIHADGRFVTMGFLGETFLSWDGVTWTNVGTVSELQDMKLAHGAGTFVAVGRMQSQASTGQILWSPDGRRWSRANFPTGIKSLLDVSYGDNRFLAVGQDGTVLSSEDGQNWALTLASTEPDFGHVIWTGSQWIGISRHPTSGSREIVWTSVDGVTWTQRRSLEVDVYDLHVQDGRCIAACWYSNLLFTDDHGLNWQEATMPTGTIWSTNDLASAPDGTLVCLGRAMDESGTPSAFLVSTDRGGTWSRASGNQELASNAYALAYGAGRFVTVEDNGVVQRSGLLFPTNAAPIANFTSAPPTGQARQPISFTATATDTENDTLSYYWDFGVQGETVTGADISPSFAFGGTYSLTLRVSDGRGGIATLNHTLTVSDPARSFTRRLNVASSGDFQAIASGGGRVVAVGSLFFGSFNGPWAWSTDGTTWTTGSLGDNRSLFSLTHDGVRFIGAGRRYELTAPVGWRGWIASSTNGSDWTESHYSGAPLQAIAFGNGVYLAAGQSGRLLRSTNGTSWSEVTISGVTSSVTFAGLAWNGSRFLLTGYTGTNGGVKVLTSANGSDWMDASSGAGVLSWQDFQKVAWLRDRFVTSGWYSRLRVSTDGGASFTTTRSRVEETPALAYGHGIWFAAGIDRDNSEADVDLMSLDGEQWYSYPAPSTEDRMAATFYQGTFITVGIAGSIWQSGVIPPPAGFSTWQAAQFPGGGANAEPLADPDRDGLNNFLEYAMQLPPQTTSRTVGLPIQQSNRAWLRLQIPENPPVDVRYIIQGSSTLQSDSWTEIARKTGPANWSWRAGGTSRLSLGTATGGYVPTEIGVPDARVGDSRYVLRLVVEQP